MAAHALRDSGLNAMPSSSERFFRCGTLLRWTQLRTGKRFPLRSLTSQTPRSKWWDDRMSTLLGSPILTRATLDRDLADQSPAGAATEKCVESVLRRPKPLPPALQLLQLDGSMGVSGPAVHVRTHFALRSVYGCPPCRQGKDPQQREFGHGTDAVQVRRLGACPVWCWDPMAAVLVCHCASR